MNNRSIAFFGGVALAVLIVAGMALAPVRQDTAASFNVMSFNIRYNNPGDGENAWPHRKDRVASMMRFHQADVAGLQEALIGQIRDLEERLPGYAWIGVGRDDGEEAGEFSPIFYRTDRLEVLDGGTFWLSETPDAPGSVGWDAALPRIVTWARFRNRQTGEAFVHVNTHFDHRGEEARRESARLLTQKVDSIAGQQPVVVTGDFNVTPDTEAYAHLTESLDDARDLVEAPHGPPGTSSSFKVGGEAGRRIDYVFATGGVEVQRFGTLTDQWQGRYPSDHLPVLATVHL